MADGSHSFNFPAPQVSCLRPGEILVDMFAGGGGANEALKQALGVDPALAYNTEWESGSSMYQIANRRSELRFRRHSDSLRHELIDAVMKVLHPVFESIEIHFYHRIIDRGLGKRPLACYCAASNPLKCQENVEQLLLLIFIEVIPCRPGQIVRERVYANIIEIADRRIDHLLGYLRHQLLLHILQKNGWISRSFQFFEPLLMPGSSSLEVVISGARHLIFPMEIGEPSDRSSHQTDYPSPHRSPRIPVDLARRSQWPAANEHPFQRFHVIPLSQKAILP